MRLDVRKRSKDQPEPLRVGPLRRLVFLTTAIALIVVAQSNKDCLKADDTTIIGSGSPPVAVSSDVDPSVTTQHNDSHRTGAYLAETDLSPSAISTRGMALAYETSVSGAINAQPLYVQNVSFPAGVANGLFVATMDNKVYGMNADTGVVQWTTPLTDSQPTLRPLGQSIDTTPVIDLPTHRLFIVFSTKNQSADFADEPDSTHPPNDGRAHVYQDQLANLDTAFWLVCLDYRTGKELNRRQLSATLPRSDGSLVSFVPKFQRNHPALLLDHGTIYVGFGAIDVSEWLDYHGWVLAYRAADLTPCGAFCTSPDYRVQSNPYLPLPDAKIDGAGIWGGGAGLCADSDGNVYFLTGNGLADPSKRAYGDCFVKLTPTGSNLVASAFVPPDAAALKANDADLGAGGAISIPKTNIVIGGGKSGYLYVLNDSSMSLLQQFAATTNQYDPTARDQTWDHGPHIHGSLTYWRGSDARYGNLYVWGEKDYLRRYSFDITTGQVVFPASAVGTILALRDTMPGGMVSLSANGNIAGSGVIWATLPDSDRFAAGTYSWPGHLYCFDASTLQLLWDTKFDSLGHWVPPTIAGNKVFVATSSDKLLAYGLRTVLTENLAQVVPNRAISPAPKSFHAGMSEDAVEMFAIPVNTTRALIPPSSFSRSRIVEGDGTVTFSSVTTPNHPSKWVVKSTRITLHNISTSVQGVPERSVTLSILPNGTWTASDGSVARTVVDKQYSAPMPNDGAWGRFRVIHASGNGFLSDLHYIDCLFTEGGALPSTPPHQVGQVLSQPFHAQYWCYK